VPTADDAGVVWRASTKERDRARTVATDHALPGDGPHAATSDPALVLGAETALAPPSAQGAVAISEIEGGNGGNARPVLNYPNRAKGTSVALDYASIPVAQDKPAFSTDEGATFRLGHKTATFPCSAPLPPRTATVWGPLNWFSPGRVHVLDETFPVTTDPNFDQPPFVFRTNDQQGFPATWVLLDDARRNADHATFRIYAGTFDGKTDGRAKSAATVEASAIVPGLVYAYRQCVDGCSGDVADGPRRERVGLIGPPAIWRGTSAPTREQPLENETALAFSNVTATVGPGLSASLLIVAKGEAVSRFRRPASTAKEALVHTYSLEIVWPDGAEPDATLFVGASDKPPAQVNPQVLLDDQACATPRDPPRGALDDPGLF